MRKFTVFLSLALAAVIGFACENKEQPDDPFYEESLEPADDRSLTFIELDGQVGGAKIVTDRDNADLGSINFILDIKEVGANGVEVKLLGLPDKSTATIKKGDILDLSSGSSSFEITAESGDKRTYTITYDVPEEYKLRTPSTFTVEHQVGDAVIADDPDDGSKGTITINMDYMTTDRSALRLTSLVLPEGASASIAEGDALNITNPLDFTTTSFSGHTRTYTVKYVLPDADTDNSLSHIVLDGQVYAAIADAGGNQGTIEIVFAQGKPANLSSVKVETIETSSPASTTSVSAGGMLNLSGSPVITVTSESGAARNYTVSYTQLQPATDALAGQYNMSKQKVKESWAWDSAVVSEVINYDADWFSLNDKAWQWVDDHNSPDKFNSYSINFTLDGEHTGDNTTVGTVTVTPGENGYASLVWNGNRDTDMTDMYHIIPKGTSTWVKDAAGTIRFYDDKHNMIGHCELLGPQTLTGGTGKTFEIEASKMAFSKDMPEGAPVYGDERDIYLGYCQRILWLVVKQP